MKERALKNYLVTVPVRAKNRDHARDWVNHFIKVGIENSYDIIDDTEVGKVRNIMSMDDRDPMNKDSLTRILL